MVSPPMQLSTLAREREAAGATMPGDVKSFDAQGQAREFRMWVQALRAFFNPHNHPFSETNQSAPLEHDWTNELNVVRGTLLRASQLVFHLVHSEQSGKTIFGGTDEAFALDDAAAADVAAEMEGELEDDSLINSASLLGEAWELSESLLGAPVVNLRTWTNLAETLSHIINRIESSKALAPFASTQVGCNVPARLLEIARQNIK